MTHRHRHTTLRERHFKYVRTRLNTLLRTKLSAHTKSDNSRAPPSVKYTAKAKTPTAVEPMLNAEINRMQISRKTVTGHAVIFVNRSSRSALIRKIGSKEIIICNVERKENICKLIRPSDTDERSHLHRGKGLSDKSN